LRAKPMPSTNTKYNSMISQSTKVSCKTAPRNQRKARVGAAVCKSANFRHVAIAPMIRKPI
jgi:hypothetical protein